MYQGIISFISLFSERIFRNEFRRVYGMLKISLILIIFDAIEGSLNNSFVISQFLVACVGWLIRQRRVFYVI